MKHLVPIMIILLLVSTSFVGVSYNTENSSLFTNKKFYAASYNYSSGSQLIWFNPDNLETLNYIKNWPNSNFPGGGTFVNDTWWICDINGNLFKVDIETGETWTVGSSGTGELMDLAWDPDTSTLWGTSTNNLYSIDLETGGATLVNIINIDLFSITADANGILWILGINQTGKQLYSIDTKTWNATLFCEDLIIPFDKILYEKDEDIIWGVGFNYTSFKSELWQININNCSLKFMGNFQNTTIISCVSIPYNWKNLPPTTPEIDGRRIFKMGESGEYTYKISSIDSDNDEINYGIDWGDNDTEWMGFYESGEKVLLNVTIDAEKKGNYKIFRIKAADTYGLESDWATLEITVPKSYNLFINWLDRFPLLQKLLEVFIR